jgi:hypothetical protein
VVTERVRGAPLRLLYIIEIDRVRKQGNEGVGAGINLKPFF